MHQPLNHQMRDRPHDPAQRIDASALTIGVMARVVVHADVMSQGDNRGWKVPGLDPNRASREVALPSNKGSALR